MNKFSNIVQHFSELRYIADALNFYSALGRKRMMNQLFLTETESINAELDKTVKVIAFASNPENISRISEICEILHQVQDISGSLRHLKSGMVLDDIEFFEIKKFALIGGQLMVLMSDDPFDIPDLEMVVDILDPEQKRLPRFFIYDEYHKRLKHLRNKLRKTHLPEAEKEVLELECSELENKVRKQLSEKLRPLQPILNDALEAVAELDFQLAKADFSIKYNCCRPEIVQDNTSYSGLFNIEVKDILMKSGKQFQPVDIEINPSPTIITGANMGGKTVLLKSVALSQYLFQTGFLVPARSARIVPVDGVKVSFEKASHAPSGLSSYANEIVHIDGILKQVKGGSKLLVLLDEPAQTTNPEEGVAIVSAIATWLKQLKTFSLITTHYSGITCDCRRLNVKGLKIPDGRSEFTPDSISDFMDYSLEESTGEQVPMNAIQVAGLLGVDGDLLATAKAILKKEKK